MSNYLQLGFAKTLSYYQMHTGKNSPSSRIDYLDNFKFTGFDLYHDTSLHTVQRSTYHILQWLGDIGGLLQGLQWIGSAIVS